MLTVLLASRRALLAWARTGIELMAEARWRSIAPGILFLVASLATVPIAGHWLPYLAVGLLLLGVAAESRQRRVTAL